MGVRTIQEYTCDCCGKTLATKPTQDICMGPNKHQIRILWLYREEFKVTEEESMLCSTCKIRAMEEARNVLEEKTQNA